MFATFPSAHGQGWFFSTNFGIGWRGLTGHLFLALTASSRPSNAINILIRAAILSLVLTGPAKASLLLDASPDNLGTDVYQNYVNIGLTFVDQFTLSTAATLSGVSVFSRSDFGSVGQDSAVRILSDAQGLPGTLLDTVLGQIDAIDSIGTTTKPDLTRKHTTVDISLAAGTYWIGMSGVTTDFAQALLQGNSVPSAVYDPGPGLLNKTAAMTLEGAPEPITEPNSFALLLSGLAGLFGFPTLLKLKSAPRGHGCRVGARG